MKPTKKQDDDDNQLHFTLLLATPEY